MTEKDKKYLIIDEKFIKDNKKKLTRLKILEEE